MAVRPGTASYTLNDVVRVPVLFEVDGTPTAPSSSPTFAQITPAGTSTTTTSGHTNPSTGAYYRDITLSTKGLWRFGWSSNLGAKEYEVEVTSVLS